MDKTIFKILKMDCASEEQILRMKLDGLESVKKLDFDIPKRTLTVYHLGDIDTITKKIESLSFNSTLVSTEQTTFSSIEDKQIEERKLLIAVLLINSGLFVIELGTGFISNSMGLVADSLDMLADSLVYALSLFAVDKLIYTKKRIAKISGYFQLMLAILGFIEVLRRFLGVSEVPTFQTMIFISLLALTGNSICLYLLQRHKHGDVHMQASWIFTSNDVIVNIGVIFAGIFVYLTDSKIPDLIVGLIVFGIVGRGAMRILKL